MIENGSYSSSSEISPVSSIAPSDDVEVKKLKDLVKKLEKQNEHLRHRTGKLNSSANKLTKSKADHLVAGGDATPNHFSSNRSSRKGLTDDIQVFDENDQDFLNVSIGDEFSWLYTPPKPPSSEPISSRHLSPQDWLKEEFEHPRTPQLSSAKRNIMYKLDGAYGDRNSSDMSYLRRSVEKRLVFPVDDYKMESPTIRNASDLTEKDDAARNNTFNSNFNEFRETPPSANSRLQKRGSHDDEDEEHDRDSASPGFPHHSHHLPVPSQTMTTAHGLYPAHAEDEGDSERHRRSRTPTRQERAHEPSERIGISPRSRSPVRKSLGSGPMRRSLPNTSRMLQTSNPTSNSLPNEALTHNDRQQNKHQPVIKSSLVAPPRMSRLQQKSVLPAPGASSGVPSVGKGMHRGRSSSPMTQQRRSLPRPSQTTTSMKYSSKPSPVAPRNTPQKPDIPPTDIWGDDDEVY